MFDRLTIAARSLVKRALHDARRRGHKALGTGHLLRAVLNDPECAALARKVLEVDLVCLRNEVARLLPELREPTPTARLPFTANAKRVLETASGMGGSRIGAGDILGGLLAEQGGAACRAYVATGGRPLEAMERLAAHRDAERDLSSPALPAWRDRETPRPASFLARGRWTAPCCTDLAHGNGDPVVGREAEIERLWNVLARRKRGNAVVIGEPGVGKTAVVRGLLETHSICEFDIPFLIAGCGNRGDLETRIINTVGDAWENDRTLFVEDLHILTNDVLGEDAESIRFCLRRFLDTGSGVLIGAVSPEGYRALRDDDPAFLASFQPVWIPPATVAETFEILIALRSRYGCERLPDELAMVLVELADLYVPDRALPGSAVDLMDDVGVACRIGPIEEAALVRIVAAATGIDEETIRERKPARPPWTRDV